MGPDASLTVGWKKKKKKKKQEHVKSSRKPASCKTSFSFWKLLRKMSSIKHSEHLIIKVIQMEFLGLSELQPDSLNEAFNTDGGLLCLETQNGLHEISLGSFIKWTDTKCSKHPYLLTSLFKMLNLFFYITQHSFLSIILFLAHADIWSICFLKAVPLTSDLSLFP